MDPPPPPSVEPESATTPSRSQSFSQASDDSQTAAEFIDSQLQLEADAREALPYAFDSCTKPLGPLRQITFACLTCNPPSSDSLKTYNPAAVCYSCSISCHGDHTLVELFNKRNFVCDCGTTRFPAGSPCNLRLNPATNTKGGVHSEEPAATNKYNQNHANRFCGCACEYDAFQQKGTMFQCLGLGTAEDGGCGEDWWHPHCLVGLDSEWPDRQKTPKKKSTKSESAGLLSSITEVAEAAVDQQNDQAAAAEAQTAENAEDESEDEEELPLPPGFPSEDDFDYFLCYKCVEANPWIKRYAEAEGFLPPVFLRSSAPSPEADAVTREGSPSRKRKASDEEDADSDTAAKRLRTDDTDLNTKSIDTATTGLLNKADADQPAAETKPATRECLYKSLPSPPPERMSLFLKADFREHLCHCPACFPRLTPHPQLLEEEESYEPPLSSSSDDGNDQNSTVGSGSLLDRGERALSNMDRVKAIEGAMAYNKLKQKLTPFFKEFAESGKAIGAEDIKSYFAKLRGDEEVVREGEGEKVDSRKEQSGY